MVRKQYRGIYRHRDQSRVLAFRASKTQMPSALDVASPPVPPPPLSPPFKAITSESPSSSYSYNASLLIIAAILVFVFVASASIHLLLRLLSRSPLHLLFHRNLSSTSTLTSTSSSSNSPPDRDQKALIDSLPLFSLASLALPRSSADCAVCLSRFDPSDELRLLPACRHAFHSPCIDAWIRSTPSCPLCRSTINHPTPPQPPSTEDPPPNQNPGSSSFRVEIGSVSQRRSPNEEASSSSTSDDTPPPHRSYSIGSSFQNMVEEEVEEVVAEMKRGIERAKVDEASGAGPPSPGTEVAEAAGGEGKGWLKEYVDRLASSVSSSFSSLRFSAWGSRRFDGEGSWHLESDVEESGSNLASSYRWLTGVHP